MLFAFIGGHSLTVSTPNEDEHLTILHLRVLGFTLGGWSFDFYSLILYTFLVTFIQTDISLSSDEAFLVHAVSLAATAIGGIGFGVLVDRIGRKTSVILSVMIFGLGSLFTGFAGCLGTLLISRIITGIGIGGEWAAGQILVQESFPRHYRARASAIVQAGAPIGSIIAAVIGGIGVEVIMMSNPLISAWRIIFIFSGLIAIIFALSMVPWLPESDLWSLLHDEDPDVRIEKSINVLEVFRKKNVLIPLLGGTAIISLGMLSYWIVYSWLPTYFTDHGFSQTDSSIFLIVSLSSSFLGYLIFGIIAESYGKRIAFSVFGLIHAFGFVLFVEMWSTSLEMSLGSFVGLVLFGFGTGFFAGFGPLFADMFPLRIRGTLSSFCMNVGRTIAFVAPLIPTIVTFSGSLYIGAVCAILLSILIWILPTDPISMENVDSYG